MSFNGVVNLSTRERAAWSAYGGTLRALAEYRPSTLICEECLVHDPCGHVLHSKYVGECDICWKYTNCMHCCYHMRGNADAESNLIPDLLTGLLLGTFIIRVIIPLFFLR